MRRISSRWRHATGLVLLGTIVAWAIYDITALTMGGEGSTISEVIQAYSAPPVILAIGYLLGHLWPTDALIRRVWRLPRS